MKKTVQRRVGVRISATWAGGWAWWVPTVAWAATSQDGTSVAVYTSVGLMVVLMAAIVVAMGLQLGFRLGWLVRGKHRVLRQRLRVGFGAGFLLAAVSPYVAMNFSMIWLLTFVVAAGGIVVAWVWGATKKVEKWDSETRAA